MIRAVSKLLAVVAAALALSLPWAAPALAQKTTLPPSLNTSKPQSAFIKNQLTIAADLGRKTLAGLEALPADDSIRIDEGVLQNARDTCVLIRAARRGIELSKETSRFPDPVMDMAFKRVDRAWNLARTPVDRSADGVSCQRYLEESIRSLSEALRLLDQALVLMP